MKAYEETIRFGAESRILALARNSKSFDFEWHYHSAFEITYISEGFGRRFTGNSISSYEKGDFVIIPPGMPHTWQSDPESKLNIAHILQFDDACLGQGAFEGEDFRELGKLLQSRSGFSFKGKDPEKYFEAVRNSTGINRIIGFLKLLNFLNELQKQALCLDDFQHEPDSESSEKMGVLINYLDNLKGNSLSVTELSSLLGMSESTFRRFVKRHTGRSLIRFYNEMCIDRACKMLIETGKAISEISGICGYRNLSHFNRMFKKYKSVTPREFRSNLNE